MISRIFDDGARNVRGAVLAIYAVLAVATAAAWLWALLSFHAYPVLLGTALLAYGFGLRHAVDADHIAAIDNVTRKMMQDGKRPVAVGFFFSLGHSTVVVLLSVIMVLTTSALQSKFDGFKQVGGIIGTLVSAFFLFVVAVMNLFILSSTYRVFRRVQNGEPYREEDLDMILARGGLLARFFRPLFKLIQKSWHMYPLGFLFGLGFDTATEVALLGISAREASRGLPLWSILVFPALFTVGMALVDTTDGILMLGAYGWAFLNPLRKLYYNLTVTAVSVVVALVIGGIETLGLLADHFSLDGTFWNTIRALDNNFGSLGYLIIAIFVVSLLVSLAVYRTNGHARAARS